jgi:hypothetical protein
MGESKICYVPACRGKPPLQFPTSHILSGLGRGLYYKFSGHRWTIAGTTHESPILPLQRTTTTTDEILPRKVGQIKYLLDRIYNVCL